MINFYRNNWVRRHVRVRRKVKGSHRRPRLSVFRSSKHIYAQLIDDVGGRTLASASDFEAVSSGAAKTEVAAGVGKLLAAKASELKIKQAVFDRGGYKYHGRVKALAEGARKGGLKF